MTTKEYLRQIYSAQRAIRRLERQISSLKEDMYGVKAVAVSPDRVQTSPTDDRMLAMVARAADLTKELDDEKLRLLKLKTRIIAQIEGLPDEQDKDLLSMRYVHCMPWGQIADALDKDLRWVYRLHGRALASFREKYSV